MPSEFSISEAPIGDTLSGAAIFGPSRQFKETEVKYRYGERYASEATNRKFLGVPLGVYLGFIPTFDDRILTLSVDPQFGYCFARLASQDDQLYVVDVIVNTAVTLDFSNHNVFPVNIVLKVRGRLGFPHYAEIVTQTAYPTYPTEILIGVVTGPDTVDISEPFSRDTPFAYSGAPLGYGFMRSGAVENLLDAIAVNVEVMAARTDLAGNVHPDLDSRLEADASAAAMAQRLGKEIITLPAGDFTIAAPVTSLNISRAFSAYHRNLLGLTPVEDFEGFASETRLGAITAGTVPDPPPSGALTDPERNACAVINAATEARLVNSTRDVAYGRLVYSEFNLSGSEIVFNLGSTTVNGTGTFFTAQVAAGDIIQDPISGDFLEVDSVTSDVALELTLPFPYATTPAATEPTVRRRFTLNLVTRSGPLTEDPFSQDASTIRVYFNAWRSVEASEYNNNVRLHRYFEETPIANATTSTLGKALIVSGIPEGRAGGVYAIRRNPPATQVGPNHIHSIDFNGGANPALSGIVTVTQRGPTGAQGQPGMGGVPGPDGPQGPQGQGFDNLLNSNLFNISAPVDHNALGPGVMYSITTNLTGGSEILFLTGGMCEWRVNTSYVDSNDYFDILDIALTGGLGVRLDARVPLGAYPFSVFRYYFNASVT